MKAGHSVWKNIRRTPYQSISAILVLTISFFLGYLFTLLIIGSEMVLRHFETQPQITAFFDLQATQEQIALISNQLEQKPYIKKVNTISKDQALEIYRQDNQDDPLLLELVTADILPASLEISAQDITYLDTISDDLKQFDEIDEVLFQKDVIASFGKWTKSLRIVGISIVAILTFTSILITTVIIGMKINSKRTAIRIMRLVGATRWYIKSPFILEGACYGFFGSLFGWLGAYTLLLYSTPWLLDFMGNISILPVEPLFMLMVLGIGSPIGIMLGSLASLIAVQRLLKN